MIDFHDNYRSTMYYSQLSFIEDRHSTHTENGIEQRLRQTARHLDIKISRHFTNMGEHFKRSKCIKSRNRNCRNRSRNRQL